MKKKINSSTIDLFYIKNIQGRTMRGGGGGGSMGAVDPPLLKKVPFLKKKSNNIILYISSIRTWHVYTCLNFTYSAKSQRTSLAILKIVAKSNCGIMGC